MIDLPAAAEVAPIVVTGARLPIAPGDAVFSAVRVEPDAAATNRLDDALKSVAGRRLAVPAGFQRRGQPDHPGDILARHRSDGGGTSAGDTGRRAGERSLRRMGDLVGAAPEGVAAVRIVRGGGARAPSAPGP